MPQRTIRIEMGTMLGVVAAALGSLLYVVMLPPA